MATFNTDLERKGPGLLYRDIARGKAEDVGAVVADILAARPDVLLLHGIDWDAGHLALGALQDRLTKGGLALPHMLFPEPNTGRTVPLDMDGDGKTGGPGDAQAYGRFFGQGSMALLSRYPIDQEGMTSFTGYLWQDLPAARLPEKNGAPFPSAEALALQRLHTHGAWSVPIIHPTLGRFDVMAWHATPAVFDGPEDRNGLRNADETRFWSLYLSGQIGAGPEGPFILAGDANLDPDRGAGRRQAMRDLLAHPLLQDPMAGGDTVRFRDTGPLRADYLLPSRDWRVADHGTLPRNPDGSRHRLIWMDLTLPPA